MKNQAEVWQKVFVILTQTRQVFSGDNKAKDVIEYIQSCLEVEIKSNGAPAKTEVTKSKVVNGPLCAAIAAANEQGLDVVNIYPFGTRFVILHKVPAE